MFVCMLSSVIIFFLIIYNNKEKLFYQMEIGSSIYIIGSQNLGNIAEGGKDTVEPSPIEEESITKVVIIPRLAQAPSSSFGYLVNGYTNDLLLLDQEVRVLDFVTRQEIPIEQLAGQKILSSYVENDKTVYFLGQYSKACNWDGYCITNVYNSDGTLYGICEYEFEDGESRSCKSLYNTGQNKIWICVDRVYDGAESNGESIQYTFEYGDRKAFSDNDVESSDILYIDNFLAGIDAKVHSHYRGRMSNGKYNDMSGDAFLITYFDADVIKGADVPIIKTLYNGKFQDGQYFEENYDSWYITRDADTTYMYYKGGFSKGKVKHKDRAKETFVNNLSHEQIEEYLKEYGFSEYSEQFITEYENADDDSGTVSESEKNT